MVERVGQVDHVGRVDPRLDLHRAPLIVERVEVHVERARDGVDATRLPASQSRVANGDEETLVVIFVKQFRRAVTSPHTVSSVAG